MVCLGVESVAPATGVGRGSAARRWMVGAAGLNTEGWRERSSLLPRSARCAAVKLPWQLDSGKSERFSVDGGGVTSVQIAAIWR